MQKDKIARTLKIILFLSLVLQCLVAVRSFPYISDVQRGMRHGYNADWMNAHIAVMVSCLGFIPGILLDLFALPRVKQPRRSGLILLTAGWIIAGVVGIFACLRWPTYNTTMAVCLFGVLPVLVGLLLMAYGLHCRESLD